MKSYIAVPDVKHPATFKDSNQTLVPVQHWSICWISFSTISKLVQSCPINHQWLQLGWHDDRLFHYYETHIPKLQRSRISHVLWILQTPKILWNRKPSRPSLSIPDSQPHSLFPFRFSPISSLSQILRIKTIQTCKTYPAWSTCDVPHFFSPTHEKNTPLTVNHLQHMQTGRWPTHTSTSVPLFVSFLKISTFKAVGTQVSGGNWCRKLHLSTAPPNRSVFYILILFYTYVQAVTIIWTGSSAKDIISKINKLVLNSKWICRCLCLPKWHRFGSIPFESPPWCWSSPCPWPSTSLGAMVESSAPGRVRWISGRTSMAHVTYVILVCRHRVQRERERERENIGSENYRKPQKTILEL